MNLLFQFVSEIWFNFAWKWLYGWWGKPIWPPGSTKTLADDRQHLRQVFRGTCNGLFRVWGASWEDERSQHPYSDSSPSPSLSHIHCSLLRRAATLMLFFEIKRNYKLLHLQSCSRVGRSPPPRVDNKQASEALCSSSGLLLPMPESVPKVLVTDNWW